MHRRVRVFGLLVLVLGVALGGLHLPGFLAEREALRVQGVHVEGTRHMEAEEVVEAMTLPGDLSILDDPSPYEARLRNHDLVRDARVSRRLPRSLVAEVEERRPVALLPTPTLLPVADDGGMLSLDPLPPDLDLPILRPGGWESADTADRDELPPTRRVTRELERLERELPELAEGISEVSWSRGGALAVRLADPPVTLHLPVESDASRLSEALLVLREALARDDTPPEGVDLRFEDQVVVRYSAAEGG